MVNQTELGYLVSMDSSFPQWSLPVRGNHSFRAAHWINPRWFGHLLLVETAGQEHEAITGLITRWALHDSFYLIAGGEWLPEHDTLRRSVRRYTVAVEETLDHPILMRPFTCLQLLDLLMETDMQNKPVLILDFLHHFYNSDIELSLRHRILEKCCAYTQRLSFSNPVAVLVQRLPTEEYRCFFPILASVANEIISIEESPTTDASQDFLF